MKTEYHKRYSPSLGRDMEFKVYGHAGHPVLFIPCQNGRFFDFENFKMTDVWAKYIEEGRAQVFSIDTLDAESWSDKGGNPHNRIVRHEQWFNYVVNELVPEIMEMNTEANGGFRHKGIMPFGCSMGAQHAGNFFFRRPDLFDSCLALSGIYDSKDAFGDYSEPLIYDNSPIDFLRNMPYDHPYIQMYNERNGIFCVGQGAWEDALLASTRVLADVCKEKGINVWVDIWGHDVNHDWDWWYVQVDYFLPHLI